MNKVTKSVVSVCLLVLLSACGGGGSGGVDNAAASTPSMLLYEDIVLSDFFVTGTIQNGKSENGKVTSFTYGTDVYNQDGTRSYALVFVEGQMIVPNYSTTGTLENVTGTVTSLRKIVNGKKIYELDNIAVDAALITSTWQGFWLSLATKSPNLTIVSDTVSKPKCVDGNGHIGYYSTLPVPSLFADFLKSCLGSGFPP